MYHPQTTNHKARRRNTIIALVVFVAALVIAAIVFTTAQSAIREQSALSMRTSILNAAKQCCAIEGAYPQSLNYLEEHYGLVVNSTDYLVTYECFADNVVPSVVD